MNSNIKNVIKFLIILVMPLSYFNSNLNAQFTVDGQIVQRGEYRHGFNNLIDSGADAANFIAHRARIQATYKSDDLLLFMSVQDIRTWGNTSQIKASDDFLSVHEAYGEYKLSMDWSIKLGRQELNYDNFRFLGNLDWALQARAHDFALGKYESGTSKLHFGFGYNQNGQALAGNLFTVPNQYKTAQLIRYEDKFDDLQFSLLFWNDGRQSADSTNTNFKQTIGIPTLKYKMGDLSLSAFYYHQLGKDIFNKKVNGFDASLQLNYDININKASGSSLRFVAGTEIITGTKANATENNSYSPLYGTNHLFNGYMDMFYVSGQHENNVGLNDIFFKTRYSFSKNLFLQLDGHLFSANVDLVDKNGNPLKDNDGNKLSKNLGTEIDLTLGYIITDALSLQAGYSHLLQTESFNKLRNKTNPADTQNWAYVMLIFRPNMANKFIGILF